MYDIEANTETAGAFILHDDYFLFMFGRGSHLNDNELGIVRLGGHCEEGETVSECVIREIKEEISLDAILCNNKTTYISDKESQTYQRMEAQGILLSYFVYIGLHPM